MSLFSLSQEIAIDLGTANTIIISNGEIVVDEPSVVAIRKSDDKMIADGKKASPMQDRGESKIYTVRPLRKGVIADYKACEMMSRGLIDLMPRRRHLFS
ncbi:MAG: rod shape-determining protein, partial [Paludibacteraceae bacterium]|nr:rod shape-determining protein [Paludibacteraceae bacterium]